MTSLKTVLISLLIFVVPVCANAQIGGSTSPDPRVKEALEQEGLKYEVDEDGDYEVVIEFEDDRSQLVWVESSTDEVVGLEVREVFSLVYGQEEDNPVPDRIAQWALQKNPKIGSLRSTGNGIVIYTIKVDASASPGTLVNMVYGAAGVADEYEKEKSSGDRL